ncbi:MAG: peptide-methionine (S)-S-oxide reductase [Limisphaerales bacterium]|jgi:peptide-methionine (S)-S-oxide reductase
MMQLSNNSPKSSTLNMISRLFSFRLNRTWFCMPFVLILGTMWSSSCANSGIEERNSSQTKEILAMSNTTFSGEDKYELATLGNGCFWCTEAIFQRLKGVVNVESGYSGGHIKNPAYREVCDGTTGHAEVLRIQFNPEEISYAEILEVFFATHDPTTLNRQGNDVGTQYRSAIFYHSEEQKAIADLAKKAANESGAWASQIVTEVSPIINYFPAGDYHQNYFNTHSDQPYCSLLIGPKIEKFKKQFADKLKEGVKP